MVNVDAVFVAHVKSGSEERAKRIERDLAKLGIKFEYMLDGDISDITPERDKKYFSPDFNQSPSTKSCALKHLLIFEEVVKRNLGRVLILEDDALLRSDFVELFNKSIDELGTMHIPEEPVLAYYEASCLKFIPRSKREKGRVIYNTIRLQCTACYTINYAYAKGFLEYVEQHKINRAVDVYMEELWKGGALPNMYQSHPDLCVQSSHNGGSKSLIQERSIMRGWGRTFSYFYQKHILYNLR